MQLRAQNQNTAILLTIHAPGTDLMEFFSRVIILTNYGQVLFHDHPDKISKALKFAFTNKYVYDNNSKTTAIDLDILTSVADPETAEEMKICELLVEQSKTAHEALIRNAQEDDEDRTEMGLLGYGTKRLFSFCPVLQRTWQTRIVYRMKMLIGIAVAFAVTSFSTSFMYGSDIGLDAGCILINESMPTTNNIYEKSDVPNFMKVVQLVFFLLIFEALISMLNVALSFPTDFKVCFISFKNLKN